MSDYYELVQEYRNGCWVMESGTKRTVEGWIEYFPFLNQEYLDNRPEWFRKVEDKKWTDSDMKALIDFCRWLPNPRCLPIQEIFDKWEKQRND